MPVPVFFNAEDEQRPAVYELVLDRPGRYRLRRQFRYRDPRRPEWEFVVPTDLDVFRTDLASVPPLLTWLVPKDGVHTPAAILHDSLLNEEHRDTAKRAITPEIADHVFRNALRYLEVPFARSWMMWAAVSLRTLVRPNRPSRWWWWLVIAVVGLVFGIGGVLQTLDLFDVPLASWELAWMGDRPIIQELVNAVLVTALAGAVSLALWGRWWRLGLVAALTVPVIALPLALCGVVYLGYFLVEAAIYRILITPSRKPGAELAPVSPPPLRTLDALRGTASEAPEAT